MVKWIKIVTDIFDDEKMLLIESLPSGDTIIVIWFKLLCLCGKSNNSGVLMINDKLPYTDEMLATIFRRDISVVRLALTTFENLGMIEIINDTVTIPNWSKHQNLEQLENRKEYMRSYMQEYREKQRLIANGESDVNSKSLRKCLHKPNVNSLDIDIEKELDKEKDKKKTFSDVIASYTSNPELLEVLNCYLEMRKKEKTYTVHALEIGLSRLDKLASTNDELKIAIVEQSIERTWKTFYELKDDNKSNNNQKKGSNSYADYPDLLHQ